MKHDAMKHDVIKHDAMKHDAMKMKETSFWRLCLPQANTTLVVLVLISIWTHACLLMKQKLDVNLKTLDWNSHTGSAQKLFDKYPKTQRWEPWMKFCSSKIVWSFSKQSQMTAFVTLIPKRYITYGLHKIYCCALSVHGFQSMQRVCTVQFGGTGSPLWPWGICPLVFGPILGVDFELDTSSFTNHLVSVT